MKLEDNFKEKLEGRRIAPTASAWDRIEGKLETEQGKKKNGMVFWLAIAASFIAGVFLTAIIFGGDSGGIENQIVQTPETINNTIDKEDASNINLRNTENIQVVEVVEKDAAAEVENDEVTLSRKRDAKQKTNTATKTYRNNYKPTATVASTKNNAVAKVGNVNDGMLSDKSLNKAYVSQENNGVTVVDVSDYSVTDDEVDMLLKNAQTEIKRQKIYEAQTPVVNANELLLDVEAEVDPDSFKDRMFRTLKKEFNRAVEAVANKDN